MAKKDRFPDAYSGGFPPNEESEGSGGSGRVHMETSGYENSSGPREKWIKLSSALHDGFGVPIQSVPISTLPSSEKQKWLLQLRSELDLLRTFKKKVDTNRDRTHATMSSSSNIITSNKPQGNQPTSRKASDPQPRINPGIKRLQSVTERSSPETFTLVLRKQCENLLKKLMGHQHGWVFNKPVDVVALKIPDYFNVIKKPMDLGTIKEKLASSKYSSPFQFAADVRLTFSNAMTYNPPGNDVHIMADILSKFFELRWKPIEKKLPVNSSQQQQQASVHEVIDLVKPMPPSKKRKVTSTQQNQLPDAVKLVMTNDEKLNLSRELEAHLGDLPDNIIDFLRKHGSNGGEGGEDEIEIDIDALNDDALFELRKMLDDHVQTKQNHAKAEPCVIELLNESGLSNSTMQLYKGNDVADEDLDAGGNEPPVSSYPVVELNNETSKNNNNQTTIRTSSGSNSSSASENEVKDVKACSSFSGPKDTNAVGTDLDHKMEKNHSAENRSDAEEKPNSIESDSQKDDGDSAPNERQVSPDKLYRAALLKNRFADTIFKAREKTLNQDEKADPEKLKREKEQLENQKKKEKARLQAEAKAAEEARKRVEAEAAAEAKRKRDLEREAARQALLKIEKTVEIDEASRFLKDLEMLRAADTEPGLLEDEIAPEQEHESLDNNNNNGGLGGFNFGGSNALEQLGLYMKRDDDDDDDDDDVDNEDEVVETQVDAGTFLGDVEEGEIN